jgi:hypothetical protein
MSASTLPEPPRNNVIGFNYLFNIEIALREFIIEQMGIRIGSKWHKTNLPGDLLQKFRAAREYEHSMRWLNVVPHHQVYYLDFSDLRKIIDQKNNWAQVFEPIFIQKTVTTESLFEIEPIRNKIAHNRILSDVDLKCLDAVYNKVRMLIGPEYHSNLLLRAQKYISLPDELNALSDEMNNAVNAISQLSPINSLKIWNRCSQQWWLDSEYLGSPIEAIENCFTELQSYSQMPRTWGAGLEIERWAQRTEYKMIVENAKREFDVLLFELKRYAR